MEQLFNLLHDYWLIVLLVLIMLMLLQVFVRSIFRLASIFVVVGVIMVLVFNYSPNQVIEMGRSMVQTTKDAFLATVQPILEAEMKNASYQFYPDGTYEVRTTSVRIVGKKGEPTATIYYKDQHFEVDVGDLGSMIHDQLKKADVSPQSL